MFDQRPWLLWIAQRSKRFRNLLSSQAGRAVTVPFNYCLDCNNAYQNFPHSEDSITRFYATMLRGATFTDRGDFHTKVKHNHVRYFIERTGLPKHSRVLDAGCAEGIVVRWLEDNGYEAHGVEPSTAMAEFARCRYNLQRVIAASYGVDLYPEAYFDGIISHHVAEHLFSFDEPIKPVKHHLKPGGYLLLQVPNLDDPTDFRVFNSAHLVAYSPAGLRRLLSNNGFEVVEFQSQPSSMQRASREERFAAFGSPPGAMSFLARYNGNPAGTRDAARANTGASHVIQ